MDTLEGPTLVNGRCARRRMPIDLAHEAFAKAKSMMSIPAQELCEKDWAKSAKMVDVSTSLICENVACTMFVFSKGFPKKLIFGTGTLGLCACAWSNVDS